MNATQFALADPWGRAGMSTDSTAAPGVAPGAGQRSAAPSKFGLPLKALYHPQSPLFWFGAAAAATFTLVAISHGHLGGAVAAHAGSVHAEAGVGGGA